MATMRRPRPNRTTTTKGIIVGMSIISILSCFLFVKIHICGTGTLTLCPTSALGPDDGLQLLFGLSTTAVSENETNQPATKSNITSASDSLLTIIINITSTSTGTSRTRTDPNAPSSESRSKFKPRSNSRPDKHFTWEDVLYSDDIQPKCGAEKCFFHSKSDPNVTGYVMASTNRRKGIGRAWTYAQRIDKLMKHEASVQRHHKSNQQARHHFYRNGPITRKDVPDKIMDLMGESRMKRSQALMIQKVDVVPHHDIAIIGCSDPRIVDGWHTVANTLLLQSQKATTKNTATERGNENNKSESHDYNTPDEIWDNVGHWHLTEEAIKAVDTFNYSVNNTVRVIDALPRLVYDFQVFLNDHGEIFHFDLDRGPKKPSAGSRMVKKCRCNLQALAQLLQQLVDVVRNTDASIKVTTQSSQPEYNVDNVTPSSNTSNSSSSATRHQLQVGGNRTSQLLRIFSNGQIGSIGEYFYRARCRPQDER